MSTIAYLILAGSLLATVVLWTRDKSLLYAIYSVSILLLFVMTTVEDLTPEWKGYQHQYTQLLVDQEPDAEKKERLADFPIKIRQVWNAELKVTDRCVSCHLGVDNPEMRDAPQPFTYHAAAHELSDGSLAHDFNAIGCTVCHQGQGHATTKKAAHATEIHHWDYPILPTGDASLVQSSCPQCHLELSKPDGYEILEGADKIMDARDFANGENDYEVACIECHSIYGRGEVVAPDLSSFGESTEHEFELTHNMHAVEGEHNKLNWTFQHFLDPQKITYDDPEHHQEETIMPNFEMSNEMATKLLSWVYSMKESKIPVKYQYSAETAKKPKPSVAEQIAGMYTAAEYRALSNGEKLFLQNNCWICHTIKGKGGKLAPDLTKVGKRRKREWMLTHFKDPRSLSQRSFMPKFNLTEAQMEELVVYLKTLQ